MKKSLFLLLVFLSCVSVASAMDDAEVEEYTNYDFAFLPLTANHPKEGRDASNISRVQSLASKEVSRGADNVSTIPPVKMLTYEEVCRGARDIEIVDWLFTAWKASGKGEPVVNDLASAPTPTILSDLDPKDEKTGPWTVQLKMWKNLPESIKQSNAVLQAHLRGEVPKFDSPKDIRDMVGERTAALRFVGTHGVLRDLVQQVYHDKIWHRMFEARLKIIEDVVSELIADENPHLMSLTPQERQAKTHAFVGFSVKFLEIMSGDTKSIKEGILAILRYPVEEIKSRGKAFEWFQANIRLRFPEYSSYGYSSVGEDNSISSAPRRRLANLLLCLPASKIEAYHLALAAHQGIKLEPALLYEKRPFIEKLESRAALDILYRVLFASEE